MTICSYNKTDDKMSAAGVGNRRTNCTWPSAVIFRILCVQATAIRNCYFRPPIGKYRPARPYRRSLSNGPPAISDGPRRFSNTPDGPAGPRVPPTTTPPY